MSLWEQLKKYGDLAAVVSLHKRETFRLCVLLKREVIKMHSEHKNHVMIII